MSAARAAPDPSTAANTAPAANSFAVRASSSAKSILLVTEPHLTRTDRFDPGPTVAAQPRPAMVPPARAQEQTLPPSDDYERRSYGDTPVGFGQKPGIVVVD